MKSVEQPHTQTFGHTRPNMSVPGGDGGSGSSLAKRVAVWGGLTLGTAYLLRHTLASGAGSRTARPGVLDTDFDSFLVQPDSTPTGVQQASRRRKKKASSSRGGGVPAHARGQVSGPFETFLKVDDAAGSGGSEGDEAEEEEDHRDPVDFASFLKAAIPAGSSSSSGGQKQQAAQGQQGSSKGAAPPAGPTPNQARVLVMYGTEFGFSREIAEKLCDRLRATKKYWWVCGASVGWARERQAAACAAAPSARVGRLSAAAMVGTQPAPAV